MSTLELRENVLEYINGADEQLLQAVKIAIESFQDDEIVSYTIDRKPLTRMDYRMELKRAKSEIANGDLISQEDLEKEAINW
jgi:hypothetical protein